jgi:hypothetical protein
MTSGGGRNDEEQWGDKSAGDIASPGASPLTPEQEAELDRRLAQPDGPLYSWAEIKAGIEAAKR